MRSMHAAAFAAIGMTLTTTARAEVVGFDSLTPGTAIDGVSVGGATFSASSLDGTWGNPFVAEDPSSYSYVNERYLIGSTETGNWLRVDFDTAVFDVGFGFSGPTALPEDMTADVTLYDAGGAMIGTASFVSDTITSDLNGGPAFVQEGWADLSAYGEISRMDVVFTFALPFSQTYKFDNLTFTPVPAPASAFGLIAMAALGARRRRSS